MLRAYAGPERSPRRFRHHPDLPGATMCAGPFPTRPHPHTHVQGASPMIVTTTSTIQNANIAEYIRIVAGETVIGINMFKDIG
ncbi:MAG: heavy metal-binding domain-containing protein, partial [Actinomycetales bacterium]